MKKLITLCIAFVSAVAAHATTYTFQPSDADLADLDHHYAYKWGITSTYSGSSYSTLQSQLAAGWVITGATLSFTNIWDWTTESNDRLWMHLLDNPQKNVTTVLDNPNDIETPASDYWAGQGTLLVTPTTPYGYWTDPYGGSPSTFDLYVNFTAAQRNILKTYITNGGYTSGSYGNADFGFGFDADCHYYNDRIRLVIETRVTAVPEGGLTLALLGLGLAALASLRRFFRA